MADCEVLLQWLAPGAILCHTKGMKNEILSAPPLPVGPALALPALATEAYTGLEWLSDEAFREDFELNRHDRALWASY